MDDIKRIAKMFSEDLIKYIKLGGELDDLDAKKVYAFIFDKEDNLTEND